jgi:hypothetical protein
MPRAATTPVARSHTASSRAQDTPPNPSTNPTLADTKVTNKTTVAIRDSNPSKAMQELLVITARQDGSKGGNSHSLKVGVILAKNVGDTQATLRPLLGYPVQQQPVQTTQQPARGRGAGGMGTTLLGAGDDSWCREIWLIAPFIFLAVAGGGGLLAGALLMEGFEHHERREEEQAYDQGYDQGQSGSVALERS